MQPQNLNHSIFRKILLVLISGSIFTCCMSVFTVPPFLSGEIFLGVVLLIIMFCSFTGLLALALLGTTMISARNRNFFNNDMLPKDEKILAFADASYLTGGLNLGGRLIITDSAIVFLPSILNLGLETALGGNKIRIEKDQIASVSKQKGSMKLADMFNGGWLRSKVVITTKDAKTYLFIADNVDRVVEYLRS